MNTEKTKNVLYVKPGDGPISRLINRPVSTRISRFTLRVFPEVTPNMFTFASTIIGVIGGILVAMRIFILGALFIQLSSIIDGCDGEIARIKNLQSAHGDALDSLFDRLVDVSVIWGITIGLVSAQESRWELILLTSLGWILTSFSLLISYSSAVARRNWAKDFPRTLAGRDVRMLILAVTAIMLEFSILWGIILLSGLAVVLGASLSVRIIQIWTRSFP